MVFRIQAVLKRAVPDPAAPPNDRFTFGRVSLDSASQTLELVGRPHKPTPKEPTLLNLLCLHHNEVREREMALRSFWGADNYFNGRSTNEYISTSRKYRSADSNLAIFGGLDRGVS